MQECQIWLHLHLCILSFWADITFIILWARLLRNRAEAKPIWQRYLDLKDPLTFEFIDSKLRYANQPTLSQMTEEERLAYYQEACKRGLESRLIPPFFTCIGKMKVLAKAALLMLIVMMMLAIVGALISAAFLTLIGLSAGFYFLCTYLVSFLNCIIDTIIWRTFSFE